MRPRLAILLSHPIQYYSPWFRWMAANTGLKLRVFYLWDAGVRPTVDARFGTRFAWDVDLLSGYEHEFVPNRARYPSTEEFLGLVNPGLFRSLEAWRPDALLVLGYAYASHLAAIAWARLRGVPLIFRGDSHFLGRPNPPLHKKLFLRALYANFAAVTYVGRANRDYFRTLGVGRRRLFKAPHAVDDCLFDPSLEQHRRSAAALRESLALPPGRKVLLFAGKLYGHKNPRGLLEAFITLNPKDWSLVFVGEGEDKPLLMERAAKVPGLDVRFLPFANQSEMPARYLLADLFCLPSVSLYETWGLAVNEAMHMGVPCLVSDRVGCQRDLVTDGQTGWVFRAGDPAHLLEKLAEALQSPPGLLAANVSGRIHDFTYSHASAGLLRAMESATAKRLPCGFDAKDDAENGFSAL